MSVRQKAVNHMKEHKADYAGFMGEEIDSYLSEMSEDGTWGDELTLVSSFPTQVLSGVTQTCSVRWI
jgi:uncharacterized protein YdbL (DUF1318 family)